MYPNREGCPATPRGQTCPAVSAWPLAAALLRGVADRAAAEDDANQSRVSNDAKVDTEYAKTRQGLVEKYQSLDREARSNDEQLRRTIIDDARSESRRPRPTSPRPAGRSPVSSTPSRAVKNEYNRACGDAPASSRPVIARRPPAYQGAAALERRPRGLRWLPRPAGHPGCRVCQVQARPRSARPVSRVVLEIHRAGR